MPKFSVTRSVPYSAEQVFAIAADVEHYKYFLPLVKRSIVRNVQELPGGGRTFEGQLTIAYKKLSIEEVMVSQVTVDPANQTVTAESSQGPVKRLMAEWKIVSTGDNSSDINFSVDYELKSRTLQFVLSGMFDMAVRRVMTAFEERARDLYGAAATS